MDNENSIGLKNTLWVCDLMASANLLAVVGLPDVEALHLTAQIKAYLDGVECFKSNLLPPAYLFAYPHLVFNFQEGYTAYIGGTEEAEIDAHVAGNNHALRGDEVPLFLLQCPELFPYCVKLFNSSYKAALDTVDCPDCDSGKECALH